MGGQDAASSPVQACWCHFFESLLVNSLYDPFGSPCRGQKPFPKGAPPRFSKTYPSFLTVKEGSTSSPKEGVSKAKKHLQYKSKLATLVKYT